ncbi:C39 family peptidase [Helicobacter apodemus]|uniref:Peptidase C39 n=1 Tax=Helicobacter apodemus TaxID=135569 RepID=A0A2U8FCV4_9HELI|nr:C39 family peptidase [Helicobacter apodemus]AWI34080.1 peptidase C39 [Helicobacter apodemus]
MQYFQFKVLYFLLWISLLEAKDYRFFINSSHTLSIGIKSYKELRDEKIIKQDLDYSCGAASLATILTFYYGRETSEEEILQAMDKGDNKSSFEDMAKALAGFGFKAQGFAASFEQLSKLKVPVVVYLKHRKSDHFSVIRGIDEKMVWLADPSLGNRTLSKEQFLAMYDTRGEFEDGEIFRGKFLAILPLMPRESKQDFFSNTFKRQTLQAKKQIIFRGF